MANVVLHRLDQERYQRLGVIVRYADDLCICCPTRERAEAAMVALRELLGGLGLELSSSKTQIVGVVSGENGYDFLGFHHRSGIRRVGRVPKRWTVPGLGFGT